MMVLNMTSKIQSIRLEDPEAVEVLFTFYQASHAKKTLVYTPAMGVPAKFYHKLAEQFVNYGYHVAVLELRGHGRSNVRVGHLTDFGYDHIVQQDIHSLVTHLSDQYPSLSIVLGGHSLGAQFSLLYASRYPELIDALLLMACASPDSSNFRGRQKAQVFIAPYLFSLVSNIIGHHPGKTFGFGATESKTLINDWSYLAKTGCFKNGNDDFDYEQAIKTLKKQIFVYSFETDQFAPAEAVNAINAKCVASDLKHYVFKSDVLSFKANHLNWAKYGHEIVPTIHQDLGQSHARNA